MSVTGIPYTDSHKKTENGPQPIPEYGPEHTQRKDAMKPRYDPWRGSPQPPTKRDNDFLQNLLAGVRKVREQATRKDRA